MKILHNHILLSYNSYITNWTILQLLYFPVAPSLQQRSVASHLMSSHQRHTLPPLAQVAPSFQTTYTSGPQPGQLLWAPNTVPDPLALPTEPTQPQVCIL